MLNIGVSPFRVSTVIGEGIKTPTVPYVITAESVVMLSTTPFTAPKISAVLLNFLLSGTRSPPLLNTPLLNLPDKQAAAHDVDNDNDFTPYLQAQADPHPHPHPNDGGMDLEQLFGSLSDLSMDGDGMTSSAPSQDVPSPLQKETSASFPSLSLASFPPLTNIPSSQPLSSGESIRAVAETPLSQQLASQPLFTPPSQQSAADSPSQGAPPPDRSSGPTPPPSMHMMPSHPSSPNLSSWLNMTAPTPTFSNVLQKRVSRNYKNKNKESTPLHFIPLRPGTQHFKDLWPSKSAKKKH